MSGRKQQENFPKNPFFRSRKSRNAIPAAQLEKYMLWFLDCTHLRISRISESGFRRQPMSSNVFMLTKKSYTFFVDNIFDSGMDLPEARDVALSLVSGTL